ncbi:MAG: DUF167 domain-containing protein [Candidatus Thorarchaeota archaeon]
MNSMEYLTQTNEGILLKIVVKPNSKQQEIKKESEVDYLFISLKSPPDKGKANKELLKFLSSILKITLSNITLKSGHTSRDKIILITGISLDEVKKRIESNL